MLVQENWVDWPDPLNDRVGNILLSRIMGADVRLDRPASTSASAAAGNTRSTRSRPPAASRTPIPAGASDHRLGGLGFANWAYEVQQQERELGVFFDTIVVCTVTGSTHAGMIAGFAGQDRPPPRDRHRRLRHPAEDPRAGGRIARNTAELIGLGRELRDDEITVLEGWAGDPTAFPSTPPSTPSGSAPRSKR